MSEYKKMTKDDVDFPNYCLYFISEIKESLDRNDITNAGDELTLELTTSEYPYCYDVFKLVAKTFQRLKYNISTPTFVLKREDGIKKYIYKWRIIKLDENDDLPF